MATDFDSFRIDDACLLVREGKIWMYYKERSRKYEKKGAASTQMGIAFGDGTEGPFEKHNGPVLDKSHEVLIWNQDGGVASLASLSSTINFAADGLHFFSIQSNLTKIPKAPGLYRPDLGNGNKAAETLGWGVSMVQTKGKAFLVRFEMK